MHQICMSAATAIMATVADDWRTVQQMHVTLEEEGAMKGLVKISRSIAVRAAMVGGLALGALVATSSVAQAQVDELNFTGSANLRDVTGRPDLLFIDFLMNGTSDTPGGSIRATEAVTGAFAGLVVPDVTTGTISDLTASATGFEALPVGGFVNIGGFSFTLTGAPNGSTFGPITLSNESGSTSGFFGVRGTVTGGAYGANVHNFVGNFSTQFPSLTPAEVFNTINEGGSLRKSYSATFLVSQSVVPEPSTYLLLGSGLGMIGLIGLRRRSKQS